MVAAAGPAAATGGLMLVLRDIHQPAPPPWWPPAPGWWWLAALVLLALVAWVWIAARGRRQRRLIGALFDDALASAATPTDEIAAMSELLRRAARRQDPDADRLQGEAWLAFLDGAPATATADEAATRKHRKRRPDPAPKRFSQGPGRLLLDGGYRRAVESAQVAELRPIARARFLAWMAGK